MKKISILFISILLFITAASAQGILEPIRWKSKVATEAYAVGDIIELEFTADIEKDWYLYSSDFDPDLGPMVTEFSFKESAEFELVGGIIPVNPKKKYDSLIWEGEYTYFTKKALFKQKVKVLQPKITISSSNRYQVCSDVTGQCIPLDNDFTFKLVATEKVVEESKETTESTLKPDSQEKSENLGAIEKDEVEETITEPIPNSIAEQDPVQPESPALTTTAVNGEEESESLLWFMVLAFMAGLTAIFTPCVFPMIPMTVSFFTKNDGRKGSFQAIFYGVSIVLIYTIVGTILAAVFGPAFANFLSTHWLPNLLFFAIFVLFALSFFGMFDIVLPSSMVNAIDRQADRGGYLGPFFMALTLVVVSFSCTGPLVGSILVESAGGAFVKPIVGMFAFGLAFGLPFTLFALFPSVLNSLPKSGGWLNSIKVTLGFVELAFAFKFLSVADQVYHWGILDRHVNIAIWIAISLAAGLYFLGFIRLPHDSKSEKISVPGLLLGIASFSFVIYLLPGMFGAPLKALSGYLPPRSTHDFDLIAELRESNFSEKTATTPSGSLVSRKHADKFKFPHGIEGYFDLKEGMEAARAQNKPVFIDFTGHGCVNCRKMEANVWGEAPVLQRLKEEYVVIALYVDDRTELPESEWVTSSYDGKVKKTIGAVNADFQITRFKNNAQPFYLLLDHNEELLVNPKAYDSSIENFVNFLDAGIKEFKERSKNVATIK